MTAERAVHTGITKVVHLDERDAFAHADVTPLERAWPPPIAVRKTVRRCRAPSLVHRLAAASGVHDEGD